MFNPSEFDEFFVQMFLNEITIYFMCSYNYDYWVILIGEVIYGDHNEYLFVSSKLTWRMHTVDNMSNFLILAADVPLETVLWGAGIAVSLVGLLIGLLCKMLYSRLEAMETTINDIQTKTEIKQKNIEDKHEIEHKELTAKIELEARERREKHDALATRAFDKIEKMEEKTNDLGVTVAGFGSHYVTRTEYHQDRKRGG